MKIGVIGAGAIGGLVAGYLKLKGVDVSLVARPQAASVIKKQGLQISGARGNQNIEISVADLLEFAPDIAILCTKSQDIESVFRENGQQLKNALILTTQNGVRADELVARYAAKDNIASSIVMFGATNLEPGKVIHNFEGSWIIGMAFKENDARLGQLAQVLNVVFPTIIADNIKGMKYLKIFVNANNCIPAILGESMQEAFVDERVSRISIAIWQEGLGVAAKAGIQLVSLPDFPLERVEKLSRMPPGEAAKIFSGIMMNLSKDPVYGSILQSIKRGRPSEIDYINGEFLVLAKNSGVNAPLNAKLVEMVHQVERTGKFFSKEELIQEIEKIGIDKFRV